MCCSIKNEAQEGAGERWGWVYSNRVVREGLTEKVTFKQRFIGGKAAAVLRQIIPDVGNHQCKEPLEQKGSQDGRVSRVAGTRGRGDRTCPYHTL